MKTIIVRYGVRGYYAHSDIGTRDMKPLSFTDRFYVSCLEGAPSLAEIDAMMRSLHCPAYVLGPLTHIYHIEEVKS